MDHPLEKAHIWTLRDKIYFDINNYTTFIVKIICIGQFQKNHDIDPTTHKLLITRYSSNENLFFDLILYKLINNSKIYGVPGFIHHQ